MTRPISTRISTWSSLCLGICSGLPIAYEWVSIEKLRSRSLIVLALPNALISRSCRHQLLRTSSAIAYGRSCARDFVLAHVVPPSSCQSKTHIFSFRFITSGDDHLFLAYSWVPSSTVPPDCAFFVSVCSFPMSQTLRLTIPRHVGYILLGHISCVFLASYCWIHVRLWLSWIQEASRDIHDFFSALSHRVISLPVRGIWPDIDMCTASLALHEMFDNVESFSRGDTNQEIIGHLQIRHNVNQCWLLCIWSEHRE